MVSLSSSIIRYSLELCYSSGAGQDDRSVREKLQEAQFKLKKSKRVDLYSIVGVARGELASDKEIKTAYKKAALKWHPDRHSAGTEEQKKQAETKFKEIGDAFELLTDPIRKKLWDEGHDREEIERRVEMQNQQRQGHGGHHGGGGGHHW